MLKKLIFLGFVIVALGMSACEKEGPAEKTGEKIDEAVEEAGDKLEKAGDKIEEKTE